MHGVHSRRSLTLSSPSHKTHPASALTHITCDVSSVGLYWCTPRTVTHSQWTKQECSCSLMACSRWNPFGLDSMLNAPCLPQHSSGNSHWPKPLWYQTTVSKAGNRASGTNGGCHIGRTWMTSAKHVHFSFTVVVLSPAKEIATAPEQDLLPPTLQVWRGLCN